MKPAEKRKRTLIKKLGEEGYREMLRTAGKKGGDNSGTFAKMDKETLREVSKKGYRAAQVKFLEKHKGEFNHD